MTAAVIPWRRGEGSEYLFRLLRSLPEACRDIAATHIEPTARDCGTCAHSKLCGIYKGVARPTNKQEHKCRSRMLCADKVMPIMRDLIYHDPNLEIKTRPGGMRCKFVSGEAIFIPECRFCAWEHVCTKEEKSRYHH